MRIVVVNPATSDSVADNVLTTLDAMGHEAMSDNLIAAMHSDAGTALRTLAQRVAPAGASLLAEFCSNRLIATHAAVVISCTQDVHPLVLENLKPHCTRVLLWDNDVRVDSALSHWDIVYLSDRDLVTKLAARGVDARHLHRAANPLWHRPVAEQFNHTLLLTGKFCGRRRALMDRLHTSGECVRAEAEHSHTWTSRAPWGSNAKLTRIDKSRAFGQSLAIVNCLSPLESGPLDARAFEATAAGGLQLVEHHDSIAECFEPNRELLVWNSWDQLVEHIARAKREPGVMRAIRAAGSSRVFANHTYRHRLERVLHDVEQ